MSNKLAVAIIDLGNVHDCLANLEPYAAADHVTVAAYADLAFAGYGIAPKVSGRNIFVFQADTPDRNSADIQIVWDVSRLVDHWSHAHPPSESLHIFVATKDQGFRRLQTLVEHQSPHRLTFVRGWEDLRAYIE